MTADGIRGVTVHRDSVRHEWIDANDHMNVAYFVLAFDHAVDALWRRFGIDASYLATEQNSTFAVECHVTWQRELRVDAAFFVTSQILAFDAKRIHHFMRMYEEGGDRLAATAEWMNLHVDMNTRRVSPWPDPIAAAIAEFAAAQDGEAMPGEAGSRMRVASPTWQIEEYE